MSFSKIKVLVLRHRYTDKLSYFTDWEEAFLGCPALDAELMNIGDKGNIKKLKSSVKQYDLIVALHSTNGDGGEYMSPYVPVLKERAGKLLTFVGNEFNSPMRGAGMKDKLLLLNQLSPDFIATQLPLSAGQFLYEDIHGARIVTIPHALNPARFRPTVPQQDRKVDIGVRSAQYLPFLGDTERIDIINYFLRSFNPALVTDISMDAKDRLSSAQWPEFLNTCKGTVATEAGTSYLERTDATVTRVADLIHGKLGLSKRALSFVKCTSASRRLSPWMRRRIRYALQLLGVTGFDLSAEYSNAEFEEIWELCFRDYPNPKSGKCISSRHFDAIGTKTCQIMFPGRYNDILEADKHYVALNRDFSNIEDVLRRFRDSSFRTKMVDDTYEYVMDAHTYSHRLRDICRMIS